MAERRKDEREKEEGIEGKGREGNSFSIPSEAKNKANSQTFLALKSKIFTPNCHVEM